MANPNLHFFWLRPAKKMLNGNTGGKCMLESILCMPMYAKFSTLIFHVGQKKVLSKFFIILQILCFYSDVQNLQQYIWSTNAEAHQVNYGCACKLANLVLASASPTVSLLPYNRVSANNHHSAHLHEECALYQTSIALIKSTNCQFI